MPKKKNSDAVEIFRRRYIKNDTEREASIEEERVNAHIAKMIYDLRNNAGLTQAELAKKIHTTQSVISRLEDADYEGHSLAILQRIGKELGYKIKITLVKDGLSEKDNGIKNLFKEMPQNTIRDEVSKATRIIALTNNEAIARIIEQQTSGPSNGPILSSYTIESRQSIRH
jgi:transcriptional regulator with XRE-family HTH domain